MMVRFLSQDGNVMSEEFMGKTDRWDGFQGLKVCTVRLNMLSVRLGLKVCTVRLIMLY